MFVDEQLKRLDAEHKKCKAQMSRDSYPLVDLFCNRTWDNILCWPDTPAGHMARQPCPEYINMFDQGEFVTRKCTENGTWWVNPVTHLSWTNYSSCEKKFNKIVPQLIQEHMPGIKLMYTIGYSLSLTALVMALIIMIYFKRLHCPRNFIHMNMFLAFGVRAAFSLMKTVLLVKDLGFANDVNLTQPEMKFVEVGNHWECKLFFTLFYYIIFASVMWLLNEGLYLQLILSFSVFSDKAKVRWFVLLGWGVPLLFVVPWVVCRVLFDDMLCWNVHVYRGLYWIIHGPMMASVAVNFVIFINMVRMLFTKLRAPNCPDSKMHRYRKLAKSTLILIPLFAVYYMVFMMLPDDVNAQVDLFKTYVEMLFNSFQGLLVALLFCFLNQEVQYEIRTKWRRQSVEVTGNRSSQTFHFLQGRQSKHRNNQAHSHPKNSSIKINGSVRTMGILVKVQDKEKGTKTCTFEFSKPTNLRRLKQVPLFNTAGRCEADHSSAITNCPEKPVKCRESVEIINLAKFVGEQLIACNSSCEKLDTCTTGFEQVVTCNSMCEQLDTCNTGFEQVVTCNSRCEQLDTCKTNFEPLVTCNTGYVPLVTCNTGYVPLVTCNTGYEPLVTCNTGYEPLITCNSNCEPLVTCNTGCEQVDWSFLSVDTKTNIVQTIYQSEETKTSAVVPVSNLTRTDENSCLMDNVHGRGNSLSTAVNTNDARLSDAESWY